MKDGWSFDSRRKSRRLVCRASSLRTDEGIGEELLHGGVVEENAAENGRVPEVVAATDIVEHARPPPLRNLAGVDNRTSKVNED